MNTITLPQAYAELKKRAAVLGMDEWLWNKYLERVKIDQKNGGVDCQFFDGNKYRRTYLKDTTISNTK